MFEMLDESNFMLFAARFYDYAVQADEEEFEEDLNRIKYVKRLLAKYQNTGDLNERLILNHLIVLYNVFDDRACTRMLCYRLYDQLELLKPFLVFLNFWPDRIEPFEGKKDGIRGDEIGMDRKIIEALRRI